MAFRIRVIFLAAAILVCGCAVSGVDAGRSLELRPMGVEWRPGPPEYEKSIRRSSYITMRDGVRIAVDVYLPKGLKGGTRLPTILRATRYWRRFDLRAPFSWLMGGHPMTDLFISQGYAVVHVDARGSGASFGSRPYPWSEDEVEDYREVIDWIVSRPWSDGSVGAQGISYDGTAAEFIARLGHPALKAACIRFALYDAYADIAFPGGVLNDRFVERWSTFNHALDMGGLPETAPAIAKMAVSGPAPVDGPEGNRLLKEALKEHEANSDIYKAARQVDFRDETAPAAGVPVDAFSPQAHSGSSVPLLVFGGWQDGVYADAALKRYMLLDVPQRLILGALNHAGTHDTDPWKPRDAEPDPSFDAQLLEMLRFFDHYLKAQGPRPSPEIVFKLMGVDRWLTARTWPPGKIGTRSLALGADLGLGDAAREPGVVEFRPNLEFRTGARRWLTQLTRGDVYYKQNIWDQDGILSFVAEPLEKDLVILGSPVVSLKMTSSLPGAALHAYLLALSPDGEKICLTEGLFRLMHRAQSADGPPRFLGAPVHSYEKVDAAPLLPRMPARVEFGLGSTAIRVPAGYRLSLVLAGRDASQFARYPSRGVPEFRFMTGPDGSYLKLPAGSLELFTGPN